MLAQFIANPKVRKVYALNGVPLTPLDARQQITLRDRELGLSIVDLPKVALLKGAASQLKFGLTDGVYKKLQTSITHISRSLDCYFVCAMLMSAKAWRVKFNLGNATFVADIQAIHNLVDLALSSSLSSPSHLLFTSSCAVLHSVCYLLHSSTLPHCLFS